MIRIGQSRDIHRLKKNDRPLIIGGVSFDYEKGPSMWRKTMAGASRRCGSAPALSGV